MRGDKIIIPGISNKRKTLINGTENANKMKWSRRFSGENKSYKNTQKTICMNDGHYWGCGTYHMDPHNGVVALSSGLPVYS